jgi:DNA-binding CsgD family transcriptional regulator/tetratricopeptide (TPR) repeat protein
MYSPAAQLFAARAQAVNSSFQLTPENATAVASICARLAGIPLAIELAAARVRVLSLDQILTRLDGSFRLLAGGSRVAPTRQQTLRAALDWGDALLKADERRLFRRLAVFAGEFQLGAIESVCADDALQAADILDTLTRLVDKSLVVVTPDEQHAWYRLLEPVRQYALQGLTADGDLAAIRARHAACYLEIAERAMPELRGPEQAIWLAQLERTQGNLRAALLWSQEAGDVAFGLRLATALVPFWEARGYLAEGRRWLQMALAAPPDTTTSTLRMRALVGAGRLAHLHAAYAEAERLHSESLALARELADRHGIATALIELGMATRRQRDLVRSIESIEEGLALFRELGDEAGIAFALINFGASLGDQGDMPRAVEVLSDSLARFEALGDLRQAAIAQTLLGRGLYEMGDVEASAQYLATSLAGHAKLRDPWFVAYDLMTLVQVEIDMGKWEVAARMLGAAQSVSAGVSSMINNVAHEKLDTLIRAHLPEERFIAAWTEGRNLTFEQAVAAALALIAPSIPKPNQLRSRHPNTTALSRREREVAALLARGYTDRQIADTLFITIGTVGVHVHHILGKLGLYSRVQVADWLAGPGHPTSDID